MGGFRKAIKTLEFDKIREMLASHAATEGAKHMALELYPEDDPVTVKRLQAETSAAVYLLTKKSYPAFGAIKDVRDSVERALKKATLTPSELLDIAGVLRTSRILLDYIEDGEADETVIDVIFRRLIPNRFLEEKIFRTFPTEDMVADEASPTLADIRRKKRSCQDSIRETLRKYVSGTFSRYLQENIVTVRNGRSVVPVKAEYKNEIKGLVHDTSATGATFFIEPYAVVEANNELRELESKEAREIEKILFLLSSEIATHAGAISLNWQNITLLAFIFAKAGFASALYCTEPEITATKCVYFEKARHPLLDPKTVVPITAGIGEIADIPTVGRNFDTLVITGPNTGGKTVSLKTLGLFALMAQSGLRLPCEKARMSVFTGILADIGDEQSIEQSLSTFSAHMTNIVGILGKVSRGSLVLFDELGAGTDPVEGAALARAVLEEIRSYHALCAATTHYSELKEYALDTPGVMNAGCEFDIETLRPTYRLVLGTPGRSNAFAISEKLGLSTSVIARAERYISAEDRKLEEVIAGLDLKRSELETRQAELAEEIESFRRYKEAKRKELGDLSDRTHRDAQNLRDQAARMIESARASSAFIFDKLDRLQKQEDGKRTRAELEKAREEIRLSLKNSEDSLISSKKKDISRKTDDRPFKVGDDVMILSVNKHAKVLKAPSDGKITVRAGIITLVTDISDVRHADADEKKSRPKGAVSKTLAPNTFRPEIDLRGMNGDEAWYAIDKYIDDAYMAGVYTVTLLHGKGTGALRTAIWNMLKKEKRVTSFRPGEYGEGDYGVTVIELKGKKDDRS